jgi:hypothetical protein
VLHAHAVGAAAALRAFEQLAAELERVGVEPVSAAPFARRVDGASGLSSR